MTTSQRQTTNHAGNKETLDQTQAAYLGLIQNAPFGVMLADSKFRLILTNANAEKTFRNAQPLVGRDLAEALRLVWPEPFAGEAMSRFRHTLETGESYQSSFTTKRRGEKAEVESYDWKIERAQLPNGELGVVCYFYDITRRSRVESALRESEERLRLATEASQLGPWERDLSTKRLIASDALKAIYGLPTRSPSMSQGRWERIIHPDDRAQAVEKLRRALAGEEDYETEYRFRRADGEWRWLQSRGRVLRDANGQPQRMLGVAMDITDRKEAEEALRKSEERYRAFVEQSFEAIWRVELDEPLYASLDEDAQIDHMYRCAYLAECNDAMARMYGYEQAHEIVGARLGDLLPRSDPANQEYLRNFIRANYRLTNAESNELDRNGQPRFFRNNLIGIIEEHPDGRRLSRAWGTQRDITERKQAEISLRDSERKLLLALDAADLAIWEFHRDGTRTMSDNYADVVGASPSTDQEFLAIVHEDDRAELTAKVEQAVRETGLYHHEYRVRPPGGEERWLAGYGRVLFGEDGHATRMIGVAMNITERKRAEESLREADRRKDEFLAMLAHELRNPLAPIRNAVKVLNLISRDDPDQQWAREIIERQTHHLTRLVDDLLDVSRITQGKVTLNRETLNVQTIISRAVETSRPLIDSRNHQLAVTPPAEPLQVEGDLTRLVQVIGNLLNNAAKYTNEGGKIWIDTDLVKEDVVIRVRDNGMGMPADLQRNVFDLFTQADRSLDRSQGGLGIGLTLVRRLVELHGGQVAAWSDGPGLGSEFIVRLPAAPFTQINPQEPAAESRRVDPQKLRVLVVEDNADSAEIMAFLLSLNGYEIQIARDGLEALKSADAFQPQIVLCDIGLPGMNGYEIALQLRSQPEFKKTRLIALTGYGQEEDRRRSKEAGFDYHLTKPVDPDTLTALLKSIKL